MFPAIYELAKTTTLTMLISANPQAGTLTVCVKPTPRKGEEAALTQELTLTATPEDFEQNFPACLTSYTASVQSLLDQTAATTAVLEAVKQAQAAKGANAVKAAAKPPPNPKPAPQSQAGASQAAAAGAEGSEGGTKDEEQDDDNPFS